MKRHQWQSLLDGIPSGLTGAEVARRINKRPQLTNYWIRKLKYKSIDGRLYPKPEKFSKLRRVNSAEIDWSEPSNQVLAKRHGISRERVRQLRQRKSNFQN